MQNPSTKQCFTLTQDTEGMFESKGSKFLAFIFPNRMRYTRAHAKAYLATLYTSTQTQAY